MLKTVVFLLDEKSGEDERIIKALEDEASYIESQGYGALILTGKEALTEELSENREFLLILTDSPAYAGELSDSGFFVVGMITGADKEKAFPSVKYVFGDIDQVEMDSFVKAYQRYVGQPWEILKTKRLLVRETTIEDVDEFYKLYKDPSMTLYMEGLFEDPEDEKRYQKDYIDKVYSLMGFGVWTLQRLEDGKVIGRAGYSVRNGFDEIELGFLIGSKYQRQGYCMEACRAILDYGRNVLMLESVQTLVKAENQVSVHICQKLGFKVEEEVNVEENIYGNEYNEGQRVSLSQAKYGKYLRMVLNF